MPGGHGRRHLSPVTARSRQNRTDDKTTNQGRALRASQATSVTAYRRTSSNENHTTSYEHVGHLFKIVILAWRASQAASVTAYRRR